MLPRYFYGPSVKSNRVRASSARNFRTLVQQHLEGVIRLQHTQAEYAALKTKRERLDAKDTTYLMGCTFAKAEDERGHENTLDCCNLLFLDLDEEDGVCPAAPYYKDRTLLSQKLAPFNFAAYTTASSTPAKPRMRIVVDAESIPYSSYPDAVRTVAAILGVPANKESLVANQPMICPSLFADQDEDFDHPLLATSYLGRSFTVEDIKRLDGPAPHKPAKGIPVEEGEDDGLEYLRAPLMGFTLEKAKEALDFLSPDMPYLEWVQVAFALRHQFSYEDEEAQEAYELFDSWSSKSGRCYNGSTDTLEKWNDVKPIPRGRVPVTIRTLIKRAADAGWSAGQAKEECFDAIMDWIAHKAQTRHDLTHVALEKVAGLPMLTATEEDLLLSAIRKHLNDTRKEVITVTALRKDLKKIQSVKERAKDSAAPSQELPCFQGWCYVTEDEKFFRHSSHQSMSGEALNSAFGRFLLPTEEQLEKAGKEVTEATLNTPLFAPKDYLLNHKKCLVVHGYDYDPIHPKDLYTEDAYGVRLVNIYRKSYPKPDFTTAETAGRVILDHLEKLIAEPEYRTIILDYIAYMVQFPGRKIRWCPLIQGAEGCGKTLMARLLEAVLGEDNVALVSNDAIRSEWNDWAFGHQVIVIPEAYVAGRARMDTMNRLKDLVTDDRISITKRNTSVRTVHNRSNYIMFTNHRDALVLMQGSRRYFILMSPLQTEEQVKALGDDYFEKLFDVIHEQAAGLRAFFEEWEISDDFPADGRAPKTKYLQEMIDDAAGSEVSALRRIIREGDQSLIQADLVDSASLKTMLEIEGLRCSHQSMAAMLRGENFIKGPDIMLDGMKAHLWTKAGCLVGQDVTEVARFRQETKYTTTDKEEEWI